MFYSQTLLARKTALGTVCCAAHLQHRLNKEDYEKTQIPVVVVSQRTQRIDSLSVRTRAVGRYLMSLSPIKSISSDTTQDLCLDIILAGKRRKLCARMFYEMLVLKSYGLIDVEQDVPYGEITLKLTPKLSKAQI